MAAEEKRVDTRINMHIRAKQNEELARLYDLVREYAKRERSYMDKVLEQVFSEFVIKHKLDK